MDLHDYMKNQKNLPDFMRDFHDQKDLFKTIYDQYSEGNNKELLSRINWIDAQCFTIDIFLWWMGIHGYKLQKIRQKEIDFFDANETINHYTEIRCKDQARFINDLIGRQELSNSNP